MTVKMAVPNKGRLSERSIELVRKAGIDLGEDWGRKLNICVPELGLEVYFVRAHDVPLFIDSGAVDFGITGQDVVAESGKRLRELLPLQFGQCRLSIAAPESSPVARSKRVEDGTRIATSFPRLTRRYLESRGVQAKIVEVQGAAEIMPMLGVADAISDLVATGGTLRTNRLVEVETIISSQACVFSSAADMSDPGKREQIGGVVDMVKAAIDAETRKYVMADVPRAKLGEVERILPGIGGPTVLEIAGSEDFVAVHAVISNDQVYRVVSSLRRLGAKGILTVPVETLVE